MVGRSLDDLARTAALTAHLFRDLEIGHNPGEFRVHNGGMREDFQLVRDTFMQGRGGSNAPVPSAPSS